MAQILLVDDETALLNFMMRVLEREGYGVHAVSNGLEALRALENGSFDLVLSDIRMNWMDGVTLLSQIKARTPKLPVILLTGHATLESSIAALRQGASDYLLKPVKNEDILRAIAKALELHEREQRRDRLEALAVQFADILDTHADLPATDQVIQTGLVIDKNAYRATLNGTPLPLTPTEFRLLTQLCDEIGTTFEYVQLVQVACGYTCHREEAREIIGTHIRNLRAKLPDTIQIQSVRGIGYRIELDIP